MIEVKHYKIDCEEVRNGTIHKMILGDCVGSLGYDFLIDANLDEEEVKKHIKELLKKYNQPCKQIHVYKVDKMFARHNVWNYQDMEGSIKLGYL